MMNKDQHSWNGSWWEFMWKASVGQSSQSHTWLRAHSFILRRTDIYKHYTFYIAVDTRGRGFAVIEGGDG